MRDGQGGCAPASLAGCGAQTICHRFGHLSFERHRWFGQGFSPYAVIPEYRASLASVVSHWLITGTCGGMDALAGRVENIHVRDALTFASSDAHRARHGGEARVCRYVVNESIH